MTYIDAQNALLEHEFLVGNVQANGAHELGGICEIPKLIVLNRSRLTRSTSTSMSSAFSYPMRG